MRFYTISKIWRLSRYFLYVVVVHFFWTLRHNAILLGYFLQAASNRNGTDFGGNLSSSTGRIFTGVESETDVRLFVGKIWFNGLILEFCKPDTDRTYLNLIYMLE